MSDHKTYLGDSVYVELDGGDMIKLTTDNGMGPSNTIYLEYEVWLALKAWVAAREDEAKAANGDS